MFFTITIRTGYKDYTLRVEHINITPRSEQFRIVARNKTIVLETNRPFFRNRGLKHRKPDWKLVEGKLESGYALESLSEAIMKIIEP